MESLRHFYRNLPSPVRTLVAPFKKAFGMATDARSEVWLLSGRELSSGAPLSLGFCGTANLKNYLARKMFRDAFEERTLGRHFVFHALDVARRVDQHMALFACEIPRSLEGVYRPKTFALLPVWTRMDVDLAPESPLWETKKFKQSLKRVSKERLVLENTTDIKRFEAFYRDVYLPYVVVRHEGAAVTDSFETALRKFVDEGRELMLLSRRGQLLGGMVIGTEEGVGRTWILGIPKTEDEEDATSDVSNLLYYFAVLRARERGFRTLNMGYSRPLLSDGIIRYKTDWAARLTNQRSPGSGLLALHVLHESPALKQFLFNNPFVACDSPEHFTVYGFVQGDGVDAAAIQSWEHRYGMPGKIKLRVFSLWPNIRHLTPDLCKPEAQLGEVGETESSLPPLTRCVTQSSRSTP